VKTFDLPTEEGAAGWAGIRDGRAIRADEIKLSGVHTVNRVRPSATYTCPGVFTFYIKRRAAKEKRKTSARAG
jgi:hypothetical protein